MKEEIDLATFAKGLGATCDALIAKWGNPICHTCGTLRRVEGNCSTTYIISPGLHSLPQDLITVTKFNDRWRVLEGMTKAFRAAECIERIALFLASDDFCKKVAGCYGRLKKLREALA